MVLEDLGSSLKQTFRKIVGLSYIDKTSVESILRDLERTLIMADVDIELVAEFSRKIKNKVLKEKPPSGLTLKEYFIKVLYDEIVKFLGEEKSEIPLKPQKIMLIGLFGAGKTTASGKIGRWFKTRGMSVGLVGCDTHRPAAQEQLKQIGEKLGIPVYLEGKTPKDISKNALKSNHDILIFDTAGRNALDEELAKELKELKEVINPEEVFLVIPADLGQATKKQTEEFNKLVGITGLVITKLDGTAKGGGALTAAAISGAKVKFISTGERFEDLETYDPKRFVSRLIGYGDLQGLLEKAKEVGIKEESVKDILKGKFTLNEFYEQIKAMQKMGSLSKIMEMLPGISLFKIPKDFLDVQESKMKKWGYMMESMTKEERENPDIIKQSRIERIAKGSGTKPEEVRELLKYYKQIKKVVKMTKGGKGFLRGPFAKFLKGIGAG